MAEKITAASYLAALPEERRIAVSAVRDLILRNLGPGYEEGIAYGMLAYFVPHSRYPAGYHCDPKQPLHFATLASHKNYMSLHLMCLYTCGDPEEPAAKLLEWFQNESARAGKKLDMGKACLRFRKVADLPLEALAQLLGKVSVDEWISVNESAIALRKSKTPASRTSAPARKKQGAAAARS